MSTAAVTQFDSMVSLRQLVANNLARLRTAANLTIEDVERAALHFGFDWNAAWLRAIERAAKPLTIEHLLSLPIVLSSAVGRPVGLADLLLGNEPVLLANDKPFNPGYLVSILTSPYQPGFTEPTREHAIVEDPAPMRAVEKMRIITRANLGTLDMRALQRAEEGATDLESKLARKLGVPEIVVIAASASLWGRSLTEERDDQLHGTGGGPAPTIAAVNKKLNTAVADRISEAANGHPLPTDATQLMEVIQAAS